MDQHGKPHVPGDSSEREGDSWTRKRLNEELETLLGEQDARTLLARCEKQGEPFERLYALSL